MLARTLPVLMAIFLFTSLMPTASAQEDDYYTTVFIRWNASPDDLEAFASEWTDSHPWYDESQQEMELRFSDRDICWESVRALETTDLWEFIFACMDERPNHDDETLDEDDDVDDEVQWYREDPGHTAMDGTLQEGAEARKTFEEVLKPYPIAITWLDSEERKFLLTGFKEAACIQAGSNLDRAYILEQSSESSDGESMTSNDRRCFEMDPETGTEVSPESDWRDCDASDDDESKKAECQERSEAESTERRQQVDAADARGDLGAELVFDASGGQTVRGNDDVTVSSDTESSESTVIQFEANLDEGKAFVLHFTNDTLDADQLHITYFEEVDGERKFQPILEADDLEDVLNPNDDGAAEYFAVLDHEGTHVYLSIPHWSVHGLVLTDSTSWLNIPSVAPFTLVLALGALAVLVRRR